MKNIKQLLLLGFIFVLINGCGNSKPENDAIVRKVKVAAIEKASDTETKEFSGIIKESRAVNLSFRVAGPIKAIYVKQGDFVKQGALVAEMDPRDYQLQLSVAQAEYNKVTTETSRVIELYKQNAATARLPYIGSVSSGNIPKTVVAEAIITGRVLKMVAFTIALRG
jgi:multidrug efflux pump subunit AcrA (membrane-fusion protein)